MRLKSLWPVASRDLLAHLHYVGAALLLNVVVSKGLLRRCLATTTRSDKGAPANDRADTHALVKVAPNILVRAQRIQVTFGVWSRYTNRTCNLLHGKGVVVVQELKDFGLWLGQHVSLLCQIAYALLKLRYQLFRLRCATFRESRALARERSALVRERRAGVRFDQLALRCRQLILDQSEVLLQDGGGTVLRDILLDVSEGVEVHESEISLANV